jgi:hypothetical protein
MLKIPPIIICLILFSFNISANDAENTVPIFRIDAKNKSGTEIGIVLGKAIKEKFPQVAQKYDSYLAENLDQKTFEEWAQKISFLISNIDPIYQDEVNAIVSSWVMSSRDHLGDGHLSAHEFWIFQLMPEIQQGIHGSGFGVFGKASASGSPIVGRNLDWKTTEALRSLQAITVYEYDDKAVVNIGFAGYAGVMSGFNHQGLFGAFLDSPTGIRYSNSPKSQHIIAFELRKALETSSNIPNVEERLNQQQYHSSHNILLADQKRVAVLEQSQGFDTQLRTDVSPLKTETLWKKPHQIAVVNCFALKSLPSNCIKSIDFFQWHRFKTLAQFNSLNNKAHVQDIMNVMLDTFNMNPYQKVFNQNTVQSMVFTPQDQKLYLYTQPVSGIHETNPVMHEIRQQSLFSMIPQKWPFQNLFLIVGILLLIGVLIYGNYPILIKKYKKNQ